MKTIIAPGLKARMLGLKDGISTNILGNRDGEVLDEPESFKTKEESKLSVLDHIFQPDVYPNFVQGFSSLVRINYYPPSGDNKEGWDNIDIFGWLGYPMQIKIDFLCRDSDSGRALRLDLVSFWISPSGPACRASRSGSRFISNRRNARPELYPEHDLFIQLMKLKNTLRYLRGEDLITHLGVGILRLTSCTLWKSVG